MYTRAIFLFTLVTVVVAAPKSLRDDECDTKCNLPNCLCASTEIPKGFDPKTIPQMVLLTFDDAVQTVNYDFYKESLFGKKNPDGCPIQATYFVSHEYTDYTLLNKLYKEGHEVALHSISHTTLTDYWRGASVDLLKQEFGGEIEMLTEFAKIPKKDIHGMRIPFLQMSGDNSTTAIKELGLEYDCSWPTQTYTDPGLWPYTLDYPSIQDCSIGPCPESGQPGVWVQPMINLKDNSGVTCAMADACVDVPKDVDGMFDFMKRNFEVQYKGNRAPFGFYVHAAWFVLDNNHFQAYKKFVDYLVGLNDVYIVSVHRALEWMKKPSTLDKIKEAWPKCVSPTNAECAEQNCKLHKGEEERYMKICSNTCPTNYPWVGNPLGK